MNPVFTAKILILVGAVVAAMGTVFGLAPEVWAGPARLAVSGGVGLLVGIAVGYALFHGSQRTLRRIEMEASRTARGEWGGQIRSLRRDEYSALAALLNATASQLALRVEAIEEEQGRLRTILESMAEGVMVIDPRGRIEITNASFRQMFDAAAESRGRTVLEAVRHGDLQEAVDAVLAKDGDQTRDLVLALPRGRVLAVQVAQIRGGGGRYGAVVVFHDITQIKRLEQVRQEFVSNVSHELRTPLTAIQGYTETLLHGALDDAATARGFLEVIQRNVRQLAALIEDVLSLSEIESHEAPLDLQPIETAHLVEEAMKLMERLAASKNISLTAERPIPSAPIVADRPALLRALTNLIDNAINYTPDGGSVRVRIGSENGRAHVAVEDSGIGIEKHHLDRLFERFYRVDRDRSRAHGGTGLGLAIVKHIVQAHGGEVVVHSEPNHGSTFAIHLPLRT